MAVAEQQNKMPIFTRLRDIASADINAMADKAQDPPRLLRLMAQEIEDTLVEVKASCAAAMATKKKAQRAMDEARAHADEWEEKARLAVQKRRDQLAREALMEKRRYAEKAEALEKEAAQSDALVRQCQDDMTMLEEKLAAVEEKQRVLLERRIRARREDLPVEAAAQEVTPVPPAHEQPVEVSTEPSPVETDQATAEGKPRLEQEFERLESDEDIERELQALKEAAARKAEDGPPT